jgi:hypothetical protein
MIASETAQVSGTHGFDHSTLTAFVARERGVEPSAIRLEVKPLRGGLESAAVARVSARWTQPSRRPATLGFVAKRLEGDAIREANLYRSVLTPESDLAPRLLGIDAVESAIYLYLEFVRSTRAWPWREIVPTGAVLARLASLHASGADVTTHALVASWDYEADLIGAAVVTLARFEEAVRTPSLAHLQRYQSALRRVVYSLPELRRQLLALQPFGKTLLHGDVHTRNVLLRARQGAEQPVFIDWGRSRIGSPLEDVSSWLHSLGTWEHEARRRHDTLLRGYLVARGLPSTLERTLRDAYWLASASNTLSGALGYHLAVAMDSSRTARERVTSEASAHKHLRVIRRADALWRAPVLPATTPQ